MGNVLEPNPKNRVLLQLIRCGATTPREISRETGIAKNKVYGILKDLMAENLVYAAYKLGRRAETIYAIRENQISDRISKWKGELQDQIAQCEALFCEIKEAKKKVPFGFQPEIMSGPRKDSEQITIEMIMGARKSILISTYVFTYLERVKAVLLDKARKAIDIRVLMISPSSRKLLSIEHRLLVQNIADILRRIGIRVYHSEERIPFRGTIVDERVMLMMTFPFLNARGADEAQGYLLCSNQAIVQSMVGYFELVCVKDGVQYSHEE